MPFMWHELIVERIFKWYTIPVIRYLSGACHAFSVYRLFIQHH